MQRRCFHLLLHPPIQKQHKISITVATKSWILSESPSYRNKSSNPINLIISNSNQQQQHPEHHHQSAAAVSTLLQKQQHHQSHHKQNQTCDGCWCFVMDVDSLYAGTMHQESWEKRHRKRAGSSIVPTIIYVDRGWEDDGVSDLNKSGSWVHESCSQIQVHNKPAYIESGSSPRSVHFYSTT